MKRHCGGTTHLAQMWVVNQVYCPCLPRVVERMKELDCTNQVWMVDCSRRLADAAAVEEEDEPTSVMEEVEDVAVLLSSLSSSFTSLPIAASSKKILVLNDSMNELYEHFCNHNSNNYYNYCNNANHEGEEDEEEEEITEEEEEEEEEDGIERRGGNTVSGKQNVFWLKSLQRRFSVNNNSCFPLTLPALKEVCKEFEAQHKLCPIIGWRCNTFLNALQHLSLRLQENIAYYHQETFGGDLETEWACLFHKTDSRKSKFLVQLCNQQQEESTFGSKHSCCSLDSSTSSISNILCGTGNPMNGCLEISLQGGTLLPHNVLYETAQHVGFSLDSAPVSNSSISTSSSTSSLLFETNHPFFPHTRTFLQLVEHAM